MQEILLQNQDQSISEGQIPSGFKRPVFKRNSDLLSDVLDADFLLTEADMSPTGKGSTTAIKVNLTNHRKY